MLGGLQTRTKFEQVKAAEVNLSARSRQSRNYKVDEGIPTKQTE